MGAGTEQRRLALHSSKGIKDSTPQVHVLEQRINISGEPAQAFDSYRPIRHQARRFHLIPKLFRPVEV